MKELKLSRKQLLTLQLLNDPALVDILFGGGAGGSKSLTICFWMLLQLRNFPGIRIGLGRKELTKLKQTTVVTLLREAHIFMGINEHEFKYSELKGLITYSNGSSIQLVDLAPQPSDPNFDSFGSLNFTHVVIEEAGEVVKKARDVFISRKNRFMNNEYNIVGKSVSTCNPSQNYLKSEYYKPYKALGAGDYQKWEHGSVYVNGVRQTAYRAFIRSLAKDNPFIPLNYIEVLRKLPDAERKRLLEGNWDFEDTDRMLFKPMVLDRILRDQILPGKRCIGVDISDTGSDNTVLSLVENLMLVDQQKIVVDKDKPIGEQIAKAIIEYAQKQGITAENIGLDVIGVGASTRDFLRQLGWFVKEFVAGASAADPITHINSYKNLRGKTIYELSQDMDTGVFTIYSQLPTLEIVREELMAHDYTTEERVIMVKSKKDIKETLGRSPDYAESAYIAYWVAKGESDPRNDPSRVGY